MHAQTSSLIIAANIGVMLFFTVAVAPTIFTVLPQEWASKYVRAFFPKYYLVLGVTTAIAAGFETVQASRLALAACALFFFVSLWWITPTVNRARDAGNARTFKTLHGLSVLINFAQLAVFIWVVYATLTAI